MESGRMEGLGKVEGEKATSKQRDYEHETKSTSVCA